MQNAPEAELSEALEIKLVAGTGFDRCRTRFRLNDAAIVSGATIILERMKVYLRLDRPRPRLDADRLTTETP